MGDEALRTRGGGESGGTQGLGDETFPQVHRVRGPWGSGSGTGIAEEPKGE